MPTDGGLSPFVRQLQSLLDAITSARTDWEREQAERELAVVIRQHATGRSERTWRDVRQLQTGEAE